MTDSLICPICDQPIGLDDPTYFSPDRETMEHFWCHVRCWDIPAELEASASPVFGPMS